MCFILCVLKITDDLHLNGQTKPGELWVKGRDRGWGRYSKRDLLNK